MMKNKLMKTIGTMAMTILLAAIFAAVPTFAQEVLTEQQMENQGFPQLGNSKDTEQQMENQGFLQLGNSKDRDLEGTWDVSVTIRNCHDNMPIRTFPSVTTFMFGGTMLDSTSGIPQAAKTPGHGVWERLTSTNYRFKFKSFNFDMVGNPTGWTIITQQANLIILATAYESAGISQVFNMNGVLMFTGCSTTTATRFR